MERHAKMDHQPRMIKCAHCNSEHPNGVRCRYLDDDKLEGYVTIVGANMTTRPDGHLKATPAQ